MQKSLCRAQGSGFEGSRRLRFRVVAGRGFRAVYVFVQGVEVAGIRGGMEVLVFGVAWVGGLSGFRVLNFADYENYPAKSLHLAP